MGSLLQELIKAAPTLVEEMQSDVYVFVDNVEGPACLVTDDHAEAHDHLGDRKVELFISKECLGKMPTHKDHMVRQ